MHVLSTFSPLEPTLHHIDAREDNVIISGLLYFIPFSFPTLVKIYIFIF